MITSIIQGMAGLYILYAGTMSLNKMTRLTAPTTRYTHIALVVGGAAGVVTCTGAQVFECLSAVGVAIYVAGNRRGDRRGS